MFIHQEDSSKSVVLKYGPTPATSLSLHVTTSPNCENFKPYCRPTESEALNGGAQKSVLTDPQLFPMIWEPWHSSSH